MCPGCDRFCPGLTGVCTWAWPVNIARRAGGLDGGRNTVAFVYAPPYALFAR